MSRGRYPWPIMNPVYDALAQVRTIHRHILEKQRFKGYSGRARALSGTIALGVAIALTRFPPVSDDAIVDCWVGVALLCAAINYGAVLVWFVKESDRNAANLRPALENLPALAAGAFITLALWRAQAPAELPAVWVLLYGLANLSARHVVPKGTGWVGLFYVVCGAVLAVMAGQWTLMNPWPMGLIFFLGEWAGAFVFHAHGKPSEGWAGLLGVHQGGERDE